MSTPHNELSEQSIDRLSAKFVLPRSSSSLVPRAALLARLDQALEHPLTLLAAPAGFGKTTLVRTWMARHSADPAPCLFAWVALDTGDNDPIRFWRYLTLAYQRFEEPSATLASSLEGVTLPQQALNLSMTVPSYQAALDAVLLELVRDLTQRTFSQHCILILEDYHVLTEESIHKALAALVAQIPDMTHIILLSRSDLPLPLARWRIQNELLEFHTVDLRFTLDETRLFLQQALPFSLAEETIERLQARTEGWIVGLKLATLALQKHSKQQQRAHFLATFSGRYRDIMEYLVSDVLNTQAEPLQTFLLLTSGLIRLTGSLCDALTGRSDGEKLLEQLERAGLFLELLDGSGQWYRYHALFAEAMQQEAIRRLGPEIQYLAANRASIWYEQHDMQTEAIEAALQAHEQKRVALLIEAYVGSHHFADYQEYHTLQRWIEQLPQEILCHHPIIALLYASALVFTLRPRQLINWQHVEAVLQTADNGWQQQDNAVGRGIVLAFRALISTWQGALIQAASYASEALALLPQEEMTWRGISRGVIGRAEVYAGQLDQARQTIQEPLTKSLTTRNQYITRASILLLAEINAKQGELYQAEAFYRQVLATCKDDIDDKKKALFGLAQLSYEHNELTTTTETLQEVFDLDEQFPDEAFQIRAKLLAARVHAARGETEQAKQSLQALLIQTQVSPLTTVQQLYRTVLAWQIHLQLTGDNLTISPPWKFPRAPLIYTIDEASFKQQEHEALLLARWHLARGETDEAMQHYKHRLLVAQQAGQTGSVLHIQILIALTHADLKQMHEAQSILHELVAYAQHGGYQRIFLDEGKRMENLLYALLPIVYEPAQQSYLQHLLQKFSTENYKKSITSASLQERGLLDTLSPQEKRVLQLLATGCNNPTIARTLVVSVNTIRTQVQSIYRKLNVNNRLEAVEVARRLHLL